MTHFRRVILCTLAAALLVGCDKEGPAEKAGREVDEAVDELQHGSEGALEKAGRKVDEAVDEAEDELEDTKEEIDEELTDD